MDEFCCIWLEQTQMWVVLFPNNTTLTKTFPSIGAASIAAMEVLNAAEADFEVTEDTGSFYRYQRA